MAFSVYDYTSFAELLQSLKTQFPGRRKPLSYDQLAEKLGYSSPRLFAMVIQQKRVPSEKLQNSIASTLDLGPEEIAYLELLRLKEKLRRGESAQNEIPPALLREMSRLETQYTRPQEIDIKDFAHISDWYYVVIKQLLSTPLNPGTVEWVHKKLNGTVAEADVQGALDRLTELAILAQNGERYTVNPAKMSLESGDTLPSAAIKRHHAQAMQCAVTALYKQPMEKCTFHSLVLPVDPKDTEEIRQFITSFMQKFRRRFSDRETSRICRVSIQFFAHTD